MRKICQLQVGDLGDMHDSASEGHVVQPGGHVTVPLRDLVVSSMQ